MCAYSRMPFHLTSGMSLLFRGRFEIGSGFPADRIVLVLLAQPSRLLGAQHVAECEGYGIGVFGVLDDVFGQEHAPGFPLTSRVVPRPSGTVRVGHNVDARTVHQYRNAFPTQYGLLVENVVRARPLFGHAGIPPYNVLFTIKAPGGHGAVRRPHSSLRVIPTDQSHSQLIKYGFHQIMKRHHLGLTKVIPVSRRRGMSTHDAIEFVVGHHGVQQFHHEGVPRTTTHAAQFARMVFVRFVGDGESFVPFDDFGVRQFGTVGFDCGLPVFGINALLHPRHQPLGLV
mmetsp:Transcript_60612/g.179694  ORF Transcript_60612/g.179694 Transcript_60612/m.179694 type:complete len:285 (-) Transcript_60612:456-1310(-)